MQWHAAGHYGWRGFGDTQAHVVDSVAGAAERVPSQRVRLGPPGQAGGPGPDADAAGLVSRAEGAQRCQPCQ